jgi:RimJ/RimL family protein N-acetyltransferase
MCAVFRDLCTARLRLRRLCPDDAPAICAYRALPEVARYQSWDSYSLDEATRFVAEQAALIPDTPGTWFQLGIVSLTSGQLIGDCGLHFRADEPRQVELGITLDPAQQGRGHAREALDSVLEYVFGTLGKHRVIAVTDSENRARGKDMHCNASSFRWADDVHTPNPFVARPLSSPRDATARRIPYCEALCFRPGIAPRRGGRYAAAHVIHCAVVGRITGLQCMSFQPRLRPCRSAVGHATRGYI